MPNPLPPPWDRFVPFIQKVFVWSMVFGVLWLLRPFFFLVFLTFVFGYILQHIVEAMENRIESRRRRVIVGFLGLLAMLIALGILIGPALAQQAKSFPSQVETNLGKLDKFIDRLRHDYPTINEALPQDLKAGQIIAEALGFDRSSTRKPSAEAAAGRPVDAVSMEALSVAAEGLARATKGLDALRAGDTSAEWIDATTEGLTVAAEGLQAASHGRPALSDLTFESDDKWKNILPFVINVAQQSLALGSAFLLSLLFSFLIVLDFPNLARGARHLHDTRAQFVYDEISDSVSHFGRVLGQALEAQLMIAILNTALTAIGLYFMGMPNITFLSMVVFICSFIPVAGVFISSVPICLTALTVGDIGLLVVSIAFITVIHMIEAYILNPRIYGAHLRMNPVLVLGILVISHHMFGMWGLILGVPVVNYFVKYVIEAKARQQEEDAAVEAAT